MLHLEQHLGRGAELHLESQKKPNFIFIKKNLRLEISLQFSCELLESLIRLGWDVSTSGRASVTPGFESITWILKSGTNVPSNNPEVNAIVINEVDGNLRVLNGNIQMNNVVKRALVSNLNSH